MPAVLFGQISFGLHVKRNIPCTLVEPRPLKLSREHWKWIKKHRRAMKRAAASEASGDAPGREGAKGSDVAESVEAKQHLHARLADAPSSSSSSSAATAAAEEEAALWMPELPEQVRGEFHCDLRGMDQGKQERMRNSSCVVAMHPDEATEPAVDFAIAHDKAWAVVPCCVFPNRFPRRTADGKPVLLYDDFVRYLLEKHPRARAQTLGFQGQNIVVYCTPASVSVDRPIASE